MFLGTEDGTLLQGTRYKVQFQCLNDIIVLPLSIFFSVSQVYVSDGPVSLHDNSKTH